MIISDSLAFLGKPGSEIEVPDDLNLDLAHLTAAKPLPWGSDSMEEVAKEIKEFKFDISRHGKLHLLQSGYELDNVISSEKTAVVLGLQHTPKDADIRWLRELGIRIIILSYEGWKANVGLTNDGMQFIIDCDSNGICIDVSHTSHETAKDILNFSKDARIRIPVIASHTGCSSVYKHGRNLPDEILKQIADQGGIIGIYAMSFFLDKDDKSLNPMFRHIVKAVNLCGADSVCIGSDIPYLRRDEEEWKEDFKKLQARLDPDGKMGSSWPDYPDELNTPNKGIMIEVEFHRNHLLLTSVILGKILGLNFYNFVKEKL